MSDISNFVNYSKYVGESPRHVQGGGGNTSIKLDKEWMIIKASGTFLKDMYEARPGVKVNYKRINEALNDFLPVNQENEDALNRLTDRSTDAEFSGKGKASIETSVHGIIPKKYVVHTHFVDINIFSTSVGGKEKLKAIWPEELPFGWIPYVSPGLGLTLEIASHYPDPQEIPTIMIFENHGIIFSGESLEEIEALYVKVRELCDQFLAENKVSAFEFQPLESRAARLFPENYLNSLMYQDKLQKHLFPDSVVFGQSLGFKVNATEITFQSTSDRKNQSVWENLCSVNYLLYAHEALGWESKWLKRSDEKYILNMGREKHRIKINK